MFVDTALRARGLKPGIDIVVIGFNDLKDSSLLSPPQRTIRVKAMDIAKQAYTALEHLLKAKQHKIELKKAH